MSNPLADLRARLIASAPFGWVKALLRGLRWSVFAVDPPAGRGMVLDATPAELEDALGRLGYAPNWEFSYYYRGEDLNLARVERYDHPDGDKSRYRWWQTHVRGFDVGGGETWVHVHFETEPTEHPRSHLAGEGFSVRRGKQNLRESLSVAGVSVVRETRLAEEVGE